MHDYLILSTRLIRPVIVIGCVLSALAQAAPLPPQNIQLKVDTELEVTRDYSRIVERLKNIGAKPISGTFSWGPRDLESGETETEAILVAPEGYKGSRILWWIKSAHVENQAQSEHALAVELTPSAEGWQLNRFGRKNVDVKLKELQIGAILYEGPRLDTIRQTCKMRGSGGPASYDFENPESLNPADLKKAENYGKAKHEDRYAVLGVQTFQYLYSADKSEVNVDLETKQNGSIFGINPIGPEGNVDASVTFNKDGAPYVAEVLTVKFDSDLGEAAEIARQASQSAASSARAANISAQTAKNAIWLTGLSAVCSLFGVLYGTGKGWSFVSQTVAALTKETKEAAREFSNILTSALAESRREPKLKSEPHDD